MSVVAGRAARVRYRVRVRGVVQGVGFRPFVHRLASGLDLDGHVGNDSDGVLVEIEGDMAALAAFEARLVDEAPPLARIDRVETVKIEPLGERGFRIAETQGGTAVRTFMPPDVAVCEDCLGELFDPGDRRYRYPFINCTNCGPRFTITTRLPYDRPNTTMRGFALCKECSAQYEDPADRRFHAQPLACAACGPRLWYQAPDGVIDGTDAALGAAQRAILDGAIVAIKGIGGYHLACDARSDAAVATLRHRKHRGDKPLAVMVRDLTVAGEVAALDPDEAALLTSPQRPIVLIRQTGSDVLSDLVAPGNPLIGVLLPYTPVHHLLFRAIPGTSGPVPTMVVMTSGNISDEPICYEDGDAQRRLGRIADGWLVHDRPIHVPCDDSVMRVDAGEQLPIRRSRGYAPLPIRLPFASGPALAVGGEMKNAFCLASGADAWMSQHLGDMGSVETLVAFDRSVEQFAEMYEIAAPAVLADAHPGYHTRIWADAHAPDAATLVQHHHAHIAAVMVEHGVAPDGKVIGYAFDGTGYGTDGAIWGGEVLVAGYADFERAGHLRYVPLPGGDATIRKPYRALLAHLWAAGIPWADDLAPVDFASEVERAALERQLQRGVHCVPTSSMGRLFDAVSSLLGVRHVASYEAQAAIELESLAAGHGGPPRHYTFPTGADEIDAGPVLRTIIDDLRGGYPLGAIAAGFHLSVARLVAETAEQLRQRTGITQVALSGGVFQNVLLLRTTRAELTARGFDVLTHRLVPPNDGGLALGQLAVAALRPTRAGEA